MSTIKSSDEHLTLNADGTSKDIKLQSNASEKVIIKSDGKVGIGTSSPTQLLHIGGNIYNTGYLNTAGSGTAGGVQFADGNLYMYRDTNDLAIKLQGAEKVRIQSGGGISFNGDTAAANALDDYEEGTHQYTITGSTGGSMTPRSGYEYLAYTKIGRQVTVIGKFETSGTHNATGYLKWSLPFSVGNFTDQAENPAGSFFLYRTGLANVYNPTLVSWSGASYFAVYYNNISNNEVTTLDGNNVDSTIEGYISFTYFTN